MHRNAIVLAQAAANVAGAGIKVDGVVGPATRAAISKLPNDVAMRVDAVLSRYSFPKLSDLIAPAPSKDGRSRDASGRACTIGHGQFDDKWDQLVSKAKRILPSYGINPVFAIAQFAIETGWGCHLAGKNNYGGIKANSAGQKSGTSSTTTEFLNGKWVTVVDEFGDYSSVDSFLHGYAQYLLSNWQRNGKPKYPGITSANSAQEFFGILKKNGYATDPRYVNTGVNAVASVRKRGYA